MTCNVDRCNKSNAPATNSSERYSVVLHGNLLLIEVLYRLSHVDIDTGIDTECDTNRHSDRHTGIDSDRNALSVVYLTSIY